MRAAKVEGHFACGRSLDVSSVSKPKVGKETHCLAPKTLGFQKASPVDALCREVLHFILAL